MEKEEFITIPQLAKVLGITRIAVYKRVKNGQIKAMQIGKNFAISIEEVNSLLGKGLSDKDKSILDRAVDRTVKEYGEVLKKLGRE